MTEIFVEKLCDLSNVFLHHGSQSLNVSFFGNLVEFLDSSHGLVSAQAAEVDLYELLGVEGSMEVLSHRNRFRNANSSSVDSLPDISKVNSTSHFLDKHWCKSL